MALQRVRVSSTQVPLLRLHNRFIYLAQNNTPTRNGQVRQQSDNRMVIQNHFPLAEHWNGSLPLYQLLLLTLAMTFNLRFAAYIQDTLYDSRVFAAVFFSFQTTLQEEPTQSLLSPSRPRVLLHLRPKHCLSQSTTSNCEHNSLEEPGGMFS